MIRAAVFDLDGTLVQTEKLKAISYARAAVQIRPDLTVNAVYGAFADVVGLPREEVARTLAERFDLGVTWETYVERRIGIYQEMIADPDTIRSHQWPYTIELLHGTRALCDQVALATMSHRPEVDRVLEILGLRDTFNTVVTREDVARGKPDPEIYRLVARTLGREPSECLVVEDSPAGVEAAVRAGTHCVAMTTPFTRERVRAAGLLPSRNIVDDPEQLCAVVARVLQDASQLTH